MNEKLRIYSSHKNTSKASVNNDKDKIGPGRFIAKVFLTSFLVVICIILLVGSALAGTVIGTAYSIIKTSPMLDPNLFKTTALNSYVYDAEGNITAELKKDENRVWIDYEEIPEMLVNAYVAVEDKRFFEHEGVDYKRIAGATIIYAKKILGAKVDISGGSTITQQLIKNLTKQDQITLPRKLQEQWQAIQLEKVLTKEEILTYYLNNVPMGGTFYGIETAARGYFGKDVRDLSLAECASLAGITNLPNTYMPINNKKIEANERRAKMILGLMLEQEMISQSEYDEAVSEKIAFNYNSQAGKVTDTSNQSYFVDEAIRSIKDHLMKTFGYTEKVALDLIYNRGLHIYTTEQPKVRKALEEVFMDPKYFSVKNRYTDEPSQGAMVIIDKDGYVRGLYGGQGEKEGSVFNRATQARRSPGSSIKPLLVYGPGIDSKTITAAAVVDDVKQYLLNTKPNEEWPRNVEKGHNFGLTTVREGLFRSRNVVATLLLKNNVGIDNGLNYLSKLGMDRKKEKYLSIAMGGFSQGMTPLEMTAAYTVFPNKGVYTKPIFFTEVKDNDGKVILENKPERTQVFSEQTVFIMDKMLEDVVKKGTAYPFGIVKYKGTDGKTVTIPSAGKTGTTDENKDKWFAGFTPYYTGVAWYGYDKAVELGTDERNCALNLWNAVMTKVHDGLSAKTFFDKEPTNIVKRTICIDSGKITTDLCKGDPRGNRVREEYFIEGTEPAFSDSCKVHVTYKACTESQDAFGRHLLASDYCPAGSAVTKIGIKRPVEYKPKFPDDKYPEDFIYEVPEGEYCTVHGHGALPDFILPENNDTDDSTNNQNSNEIGVLPNNPPSERILTIRNETDWNNVDWGHPNSWD